MISTALESAQINYYDEDSDVILSDGNWTVYKANYEQHLAKINLTVYATTNTEINKTFWVRAYDETDNLPNMRQSVKEVLEKAFTPVNCVAIGYPDKSLCLATNNDGYILLDGDANFDFQFYDSEGQPLDTEASFAAFQALTQGDDLFAINLPRGTTLTIDDYSVRAPEFASVNAIVEQYNQTGGQHLEVGAIVYDYYGIDTVQFCKSDNDCYDMSPSLPNQSQNPVNGYYTLSLTDYALQGTEYLAAKNVVGNTTTQSPISFYLSLVESAYQAVEGYGEQLKEIDQWLSYWAAIRVTDPLVNNEIIDNNLMDDEATTTATYLSLLELLNQTKQACAFNNAQPLDDAETLLTQQVACDDALQVYEQAVADNPMRIYNPYKMPIKNILISDNKGISGYSGSGTPSNLVSCHLGNLDLITGMRIGYKILSDDYVGIRLFYRSIERSGITDPLFKWSPLKSKTCGDDENIDEQSWVESKDYINGNTITALTDFGWSVQSGNATKLCVVHWDFDLNTASFIGEYGDYCSGTSAWSGIEANTNDSSNMPNGNPGPKPESMNDVFLNAKYEAAESTHARHFSYSLNYQNVLPLHNLVHDQEYRIRSNDGRLLTLAGNQQVSRSITLEPDNNQDDQIWIVEIVNDREFRLRPKSFDGYLGRPNLGGAEGNTVSVFHTTLDDETTVNHNQHWRLGGAYGTYFITSVVNSNSLSRESLLLEEEGSPLDPRRWTFHSVMDPDGGSTSLTVELESLSGQSNFFVVQNDDNAYGGQYVVWPNNGDQFFDPASDSEIGEMQINFNLSQAADVQFDIRVNMPGDKDDSFWYQLDSGWSLFHQGTNGWSSLTPKTFTNLSAGSHTLVIVRREDGAQLDNVTLTTSAGIISPSTVGYYDNE